MGINLSAYSGLLVNLLSDPHLDHDSTALHMYRGHHTFLLIDLENPELGPFEAVDTRYPIVVVDRFKNGSSVYIRCYPVAANGEVMRGMASGSYIVTCDSRFRRAVNQYPIALHDRFEN